MLDENRGTECRAGPAQCRTALGKASERVSKLSASSPRNNEKILLGYEVLTGSPVQMGPHHLVITGMTGESGKTTTIEALLSRGKLTALVFRTKRGELGFESAIRIPPF